MSPRKQYRGCYVSLHVKSAIEGEQGVAPSPGLGRETCCMLGFACAHLIAFEPEVATRLSPPVAAAAVRGRGGMSASWGFDLDLRHSRLGIQGVLSAKDRTSTCCSRGPSSRTWPGTQGSTPSEVCGPLPGMSHSRGRTPPTCENRSQKAVQEQAYPRVVILNFGPCSRGRFYPET